jgi:hypothetical protein
MAAVEQPDDPLGVDLEGGDLPPEPLDPWLVGPGELGIGQLTHQGDHQLAQLALVGAGDPIGDRNGAWCCCGVRDHGTPA